MYKLVVLFLSVNNAFGANILYVAPMPSPSHHIWNRALALGLVSKGHNVTHIGPDAENLKMTNYTYILMEGVYEALERNFDMNGLGITGPLGMLYMFRKYSLTYCEASVETQGLQKLINYPKDFKFDLVLFDNTGGGCLYPLIQRFNYPPTVAVTAFLLPPYVANSFGNHLYPAYEPWYNLPYGQNMTFLERVWNFIFTYVDTIIKHPRQQKTVDAMMRKVFGEDVATIEDIERHISLVLANTDPILNYPQPLVPNIIPVGGLQTRPPKKLPQDIQTLLDDSKNGVIVFSLGTNVRSDKLSKDTQKGLFEAFSQIKETVIWKFESDIDNLPKNVVVRKWLPQNDVLGHPNVKLFIGHGGGLSTQEAMYHGVPMICIPFFVDQHINTRNVVERNLGVFLDFSKITKDYVKQKLREVLDNPTYSENMKLVSKRFKDRPETPLERGIFWAEYVLRNGGAHFLNSPARDLPFYVGSGLDVLVFLTLVVLIPLVLVYKVLRGVLRLLSGKRKVKTN